MEARKIEQREPLRAPLDLLAQHLITLALGGGFSDKEALQEVRTAWSYRICPKRSGAGHSIL